MNEIVWFDGLIEYEEAKTSMNGIDWGEERAKQLVDQLHDFTGRKFVMISHTSLAGDRIYWEVQERRWFLRRSIAKFRASSGREIINF